ncbi:MAG: GLPGLI family protein [Dysgonamonadaceae bacterium]|jgi:GLPGLI family protein|nr:GLPGLI family protein [Dysgonamonadaceae bacterium]
MKKLFLFIAMILPIGVFSQVRIQIGGSPDVKYEVIDTVAVRVFYETNSLRNPEKPESVEKDYQALEIGASGVSRYYSDNKRRQDSIMTEYFKNKADLSNIDLTNVLKDNGLSSSGTSLEVYKNYPAGKISVTDRIGMSDYLYEDDLNNIQWEILPDTKEILSYTCQKATTHFRGRQFEAWFAPDLPISNGPWKFSGLPGLILSVEDAAGHYTFQAIGIENQQYPILFPKKTYLKASRTEVDKVKRKFEEDPMGSILNSSPAGDIKIVVKDASGREMSADEIRNRNKNSYNPLELE